ncbi:MAG TPA: hypothetical protein VFQ61_14290, partial [Polyangiaceae bacterium]|nr:hypothetical protein [Polyangiaceae bacterium]
MLAPLWKTSRWLTLAVLAGTAVTACASGADSSPDPDEAGVDLADSSQAITLCTTDGMACSVTTRETGVCVNGSCCTGCVNRVLIGTKGACAVGDSLTMCGSGGDACRNCDDNNPCTADACTAKGCTHTIVEGSCSGGVCVQGQCCTGCIDGDGNCQKGLSPDGCGRGGGKCTTCFDRQPCTFDLCLEGSCQYPQKDDNTSCESDKDVCNGESICRGGKCVAGTPLNCDDNNPCTDDKCDPAAGCQKSPIEGSCNDGDPCTISDTCVEGSCKGGATATCNDNEVCTQDLCDSTGSGCKNVPIDQGKDCDDGNSCSTASICDNGKCVTTAGTACDDNNPCTRNRCTGGAGCYYTDLEPVNTPCIPANNKCVLNATCNETGACTGGEEKSCDDNNPCTEEHCDPQSGECVSSKLNTGECNDGSACTVDDSCQDGVCQGTAKECPT